MRDLRSDVRPGGIEVCDPSSADEDCDGAADNFDKWFDVIRNGGAPACPVEGGVAAASAAHLANQALRADGVATG